MKPLLTLLAAASLLASAGMAPAEPARSLNDARSQINSGTWPGITLIEAKPKAAKAEPPAGAASAAPAPAPVAAVPAPAAAATAGTAAKAADTAAASPDGQSQPPAAPATPVAAAPAPAAPAAPAAATPATAPAAVATSPSVAERLRAVLGPPSGVPMNQATRLDSPDRGIVLPTGTAAAASGAAK